MRAGKTVTITVSLPIMLAAILNETCEEHDLNRSSVVASAIRDYLKDLGIEVRER